MWPNIVEFWAQKNVLSLEKAPSLSEREQNLIAEQKLQATQELINTLRIKESIVATYTPSLDSSTNRPNSTCSSLDELEQKRMLDRALTVEPLDAEELRIKDLEFKVSVCDRFLELNENYSALLFSGGSFQSPSVERSLSDAVILLHRGNALYALGRYEEALKDFNRSNTLDPHEITLINYEITFGKRQDLRSEHIRSSITSISPRATTSESFATSDAQSMTSVDTAPSPLIFSEQSSVTLKVEQKLKAKQKLQAEQKKKETVEKIKDLESELAGYNQSLADNKDDANLFFNRANTLCSLAGYNDPLKHYMDALKDYNRALALNPKDENILFNRGNVQYAIGLYSLLPEYAFEYQEAARNDYMEVLKLTPNNPRTLNKLGLTLRALGLTKEALEAYSRSIEFAQKADTLENRTLLAEVLANRAVLLDDLKHYEEAFLDYDHSLKLKPDDAATLNNCGVTLWALDRKDKALEYFNRSIELMPDDGNIFYNRILVLQALGRTTESMSDLIRAEELSEANSEMMGSRSFTKSIPDDSKKNRFR